MKKIQAQETMHIPDLEIPRSLDYSMFIIDNYILHMVFQIMSIYIFYIKKLIFESESPVLIISFNLWSNALCLAFC